MIFDGISLKWVLTNFTSCIYIQSIGFLGLLITMYVPDPHELRGTARLFPVSVMSYAMKYWS